MPRTVSMTLPPKKRQRLAALCLLCLVLLASGCEMMHWLHPRQLWKMNRQPAPRSEDDYFSIPDPPRQDQPSDTEAK